MALLSLLKALPPLCMAIAQVREDLPRTCQATVLTKVVCLGLLAFPATDSLRVDLIPLVECPAMAKLLLPLRVLAVVASLPKDLSKAVTTVRATATWACLAVLAATVRSRTQLVDGVNNAEAPTTALEVLLATAVTSNLLRAFVSSTMSLLILVSFSLAF